MSFIPSADFALEIAKGNISKHSIITKFGFNTDIDVGVDEDIWSNGGTFVAPTTARLHNIASTSANDTSAGTGARTVLIRGINESYNAVSETLTLNGTSNVATVNSYVHIHLMQVITVGSVGSNVGIVSVTAQTDATVTASIPIGFNQSTSAIYMVPVGYKTYIIKVRGRFTNPTANSSCYIDLLIMPFGGGFQVKTKLGVNNSGNSFVVNDYSNSSPFIVQAKSMIKMRASAVTNNNSEVTGEYDLILVQD